MPRHAVALVPALLALVAGASCHSSSPPTATAPPPVETATTPAKPATPALDARAESERCAAMLASIVPDLEASLDAKLTAKDKRCSILKKLADPAALALMIDRLPSIEGEWSPSRLAVRSGDRWYGLTLGTRATQILALERGPWERTLRLDFAIEEWEPGAGIAKRRLLVICQLPVEAGAAPRCAQHTVAYKFAPPADEGAPEDWIAAAHLTAEGIRFAPIKGIYPADMDMPLVGDMTLAAFLATGAKLEPE